MTAVVDRRGGGAPVGRDTIGRRSVAASSGALRLAWREVRRAKARTALVVMLIAVPIGAMAFASVITRSVNLTERQRAMVALGSVADARFASFGSADAAALPLADAVHADVTRAYVGPVRLGPGAHDASVIVADLASPLLRGAYDLTAGYAPLTADEAAISVAAARKYHVGVGDRVALLRTGQEWAVSGVYRDADQVGEVAIVVARMPSGVRPTDVYRYVTADTDALRAVLATASTVTAVRNPGLPQPFDAGGKTFLLPLLGIYAMGIVGLFVTGTVVSAAFAAGARRQLRTMGLVAASGGSPAFVCTVLVAQGLVCGVLGALVGLAASAAGVAIIAPHVDRLVGFVLPGLHSRASDLAIIALLAIAASAAAAAIPAVGLGRVPVLSALAGRRPARQPSSAVPVIGLVLFGLGLVGVAVSAGLPYTGYGALQLALYSGASLAMLVGAVLAAPWLVGRLETASIGARGALRVAARTMARSRNRTGPIAAAILVTVGLATIIGVYHAATISYADATESAGGDPRAIVITTSYDAPRGAVGFPGLRPSAATAPKTVASVVAVAPDATVFPTRTVVTPAEQAGAGYGDSWLVVPLGTVTGPAATIERAGQPIASDRGTSPPSASRRTTSRRGNGGRRSCSARDSSRTVS